MLRFVVVVVALLGGTSAYAQSATHSRSEQQKPAPAAQTPSDPNDIAAVPRDVQKWIGGAVGDILTGADKVVEPERGGR